MHHNIIGSKTGHEQVRGMRYELKAPFVRRMKEFTSYMLCLILLPLTFYMTSILQIEMNEFKICSYFIGDICTVNWKLYPKSRLIADSFIGDICAVILKLYPGYKLTADS